MVLEFLIPERWVVGRMHMPVVSSILTSAQRILFKVFPIFLQNKERAEALGFQTSVLLTLQAKHVGQTRMKTLVAF